MELTQRYTTQSGKGYQIRIVCNEKIGERDGMDRFLRTVDVFDAALNPVSLPLSAGQFSTYQNFTSFGAYSSINYLGVREAALEGLRTKILTRIQDHLEALG